VPYDTDGKLIHEIIKLQGSWVEAGFKSIKRDKKPGKGRLHGGPGVSRLD
jgi:hypothetical protein